MSILNALLITYLWPILRWMVSKSKITPFNHVIYRLSILTLMAFVLGATVSLLAIAFVECVSWLNDVLLISPRTRIQVQSPLLLTAATILIPTLGGLTVGWLLQKYSPDQRPLGPPDSIRAVQLRSELPSLRSGLISTLAAILSLGCGASVGQYGPMVYLGSMFGGLITGFAGGVFSPALLIGILFGALFWSTLALLGVPNSGVVVYAICGMVALSSPVIGAPLTTILIIFELTRNYDLTIAAMVAVVFANLLAFRIFGRSLFDIQLARKGIDLSFGRDRAMLTNTRVMDYLVDDFLAFDTKTSIDEAVQALADKGRAEATILDQKGNYLGMLRLQDTIQQSSEGTVANVALTDWPIFNESTSIWQAMGALDQFIGEAIPVVSADDGQLLGMITEAGLIEAYMEIVHDLRSEENESV